MEFRAVSLTQVNSKDHCHLSSNLLSQLLHELDAPKLDQSFRHAQYPSFHAFMNLLCVLEGNAFCHHSLVSTLLPQLTYYTKKLPLSILKLHNQKLGVTFIPLFLLLIERQSLLLLGMLSSTSLMSFPKQGRAEIVSHIWSLKLANQLQEGVIFLFGDH